MNHFNFQPRIWIALVAVFLVVPGPISCSTRPYRLKRAETLYRQGQLYSSKGEFKKAYAKFEESLAVAKMIDFKPGIAHNLNEMAIILTAARQFKQAREKLNQAMAIYKTLEMNPEVSKTMNNIASTYLREGRLDEALSHYEQLIDWDQRTGNKLGVGISLFNMAVLYQNHLREYEQARKRYLEALTIFKALGNEKYTRIIEKSLAGER